MYILFYIIIPFLTLFAMPSLGDISADKKCSLHFNNEALKLYPSVKDQNLGKNHESTQRAHVSRLTSEFINTQAIQPIFQTNFSYSEFIDAKITEGSFNGEMRNSYFIRGDISNTHFKKPVINTTFVKTQMDGVHFENAVDNLGFIDVDISHIKFKFEKIETTNVSLTGNDFIKSYGHYFLNINNISKDQVIHIISSNKNKMYFKEITITEDSILHTNPHVSYISISSMRTSETRPSDSEYTSEDLQFFRVKTLGQPVIMEDKTYKSIGAALPNRLNIVVSKQKDFKIQNDDAITVTTDLGSALKQAAKFVEDRADKEIFIVGSNAISKDEIPMLEKEVIPLIDKIYLTRLFPAGQEVSQVDPIIPSYFDKPLLLKKGENKEEGLSYKIQIYDITNKDALNEINHNIQSILIATTLPEDGDTSTLLSFPIFQKMNAVFNKLQEKI